MGAPGEPHLPPQLLHLEERFGDVPPARPRTRRVLTVVLALVGAFVVGAWLWVFLAD
jgi:hypothetical protein